MAKVIPNMNLNFTDIKNQDNKQKIMIGVFVVTILVTSLVMYFNYFSQEVAVSVVSPIATPTSMMGEQKLDLAVLESKKFQDLRKFGVYPVDVKRDEVGRSNPFSPF